MFPFTKKCRQYTWLLFISLSITSSYKASIASEGYGDTIGMSQSPECSKKPAYILLVGCLTFLSTYYLCDSPASIWQDDDFTIEDLDGLPTVSSGGTMQGQINQRSLQSLDQAIPAALGMETQRDSMHSLHERLQGNDVQEAVAQHKTLDGIINSQVDRGTKHINIKPQDVHIVSIKKKGKLDDQESSDIPMLKGTILEGKINEEMIAASGYSAKNITYTAVVQNLTDSLHHKSNLSETLDALERANDPHKLKDILFNDTHNDR